MENNRAASSSDLERARAVSRQLRPDAFSPGAKEAGTAPTPAGAPAAPRPAFSAERARALTGAVSPPPTSPPPSSASPAPSGPGAVDPATTVAVRAGATPPTTGRPVSPPPFRAPAAPPGPPAPPPSVAASPRPSLPAPPAGGSWEELLAWLRTAFAAEAGFIIDRRGLLVANSGRTGDEEAQAMGSRLVMALDQADELDRAAPVRALTIDLTSRWLTGFRLPLATGPVLTLGVISAKPLATGATALVARVFAARLADA